VTPRNAERFVDSLVRGERPRSFEASDEEAALIGTAITLHAGINQGPPRQQFVSDLFEELASSQEGSDRRRTWVPRKVAALAVAAVALVTVAVGATAAIDTALQSSAVHGRHLHEATMVDLLHRHVGQITLLSGEPSWVLMNLVGVPYDGQVTCELRGTAGTVIMKGTFDLRDGSAVWAKPITIAPGQVRSARIVTAAGQVLASADASAFNR
jgi:hypothetical protein